MGGDMNKRQRKKHNVYRARVRIFESTLAPNGRFYLVDAETARRIKEFGGDHDELKMRKIAHDDNKDWAGWTWVT